MNRARLYDKFRKQVVDKLEVEQWLQSECLFRKRDKIPGMIMALDCMRIPCSSRKKYAFMAACRQDGYIISNELFLNMPEPECLRDSLLYRDVLRSGRLPSFLPVAGALNDQWILPAFALIDRSLDPTDRVSYQRSHLVRLFSPIDVNGEEVMQVEHTSFNRQARRARGRIESTFGHLKTRFRFFEHISQELTFAQAESFAQFAVQLFNFDRGLSKWVDRLPGPLRTPVPTLWTKEQLEPRQILMQLLARGKFLQERRDYFAGVGEIEAVRDVHDL